MEPNSTASQVQPFNLQARVVNILTKPKLEWPVIALEPRNVAAIYSSYIVLLAAIPAVCGAIGRSLVGISFGFGYYRWGLTSSIVMAVMQYVLTLVGVYVSAIVVAKLAPNFQSEPDTAQALKLVAYAWTPVWVAGVLLLLPALSPLVLLAALYSLYLLYLGVGPVMKTPADKAIPYLVVSAIVLIVIYFIVGVISGAILAAVGLGVAGALAGPTI